MPITMQIVVDKSDVDIHAILLNNLGRAAAEVKTEEFEEIAERSLRSAAEMDSEFAEYWLDLGYFYAKRSQFSKAKSALSISATLSDTIPEIHELSGHVHAELGDHVSAASSYRQAARIDLARDKDLIAAAREFLKGNQIDGAIEALNSVHLANLETAFHAEFELLRLETRQSSDLRYLESELMAIVERFPDSQLAQQNLALARSERSGFEASWEQP